MANKDRVRRAGISDIRWEILTFLKQRRRGSIAELARHLRLSYEAVRQHGVQLEKEGLIEKQPAQRETPNSGRPLQPYALTPAGDRLFPRHYDGLSTELIATVSRTLGTPVLKRLLAALAKNRVDRWAPALEGKSLEERVRALRDIYLDGDPYMSIESDDDGIRLVENNCPFLNVALEHPALCSVTLATLQQLLGVRVVREERFQSGNGRCVFRILPHRPIDPKRYEFALEDEVGQ